MGPAAMRALHGDALAQLGQLDIEPAQPEVGPSRSLTDERTRAIPVVAVTAFALVGDERKALAGGCDGYVSKPIALRNFLDLVERFIGTA
jgi:CheY-like chemotaxis protein